MFYLWGKHGCVNATVQPNKQTSKEKLKLYECKLEEKMSKINRPTPSFPDPAEIKTRSSTLILIVETILETKFMDREGFKNGKTCTNFDN